MTATTLPFPRYSKGALAKFWLAILLLVAAGLGLAWFAASPMRGETTGSGLVIRTVQEGTGPQISAADAVLIDYEGRLPDGTVFDSSASHGGPQALAPSQTIPGFAEALLRMRKGGTYSIRIPPNLAYGEASPPGIPANSPLEFDVRVVDIARGAAAMAGQASRQAQQPQPQQIEGQ